MFCFYRLNSVDCVPSHSRVIPVGRKVTSCCKQVRPTNSRRLLKPADEDWPLVPCPVPHYHVEPGSAEDTT